jgi:hypothetical protein
MIFRAKNGVLKHNEVLFVFYVAKMICAVFVSFMANALLLEDHMPLFTDTEDYYCHLKTKADVSKF